MTIQRDLNENTVTPGVARKQTLRNSVAIYRQGLLGLYGRVVLRDLDNNVIK